MRRYRVAIAASVLAGTANREIPPGDLEVSGLSYQRPRRKFFRIDEDAIADAVEAVTTGRPIRHLRAVV